MRHERSIWTAGLLAVALAAPLARADHHEHGGHAHGKPAAGAADDHAAKGAAVTLEGEVLDLHCFMLHPESGQGPDHAACAKTCMNKGLPIGFLAKDGTVYLLLGGGHDSVKSKVVKDAGYPVTLKGTLVEHHGVKAIQVGEVKRSGTKPAAAKPADQPAAKKDVWMCPMGCAKSDKPGKCPACGMDMDKQKG